MLTIKHIGNLGDYWRIWARVRSKFLTFWTRKRRQNPLKIGAGMQHLPGRPQQRCSRSGRRGSGVPVGPPSAAFGGVVVPSRCQRTLQRDLMMRPETTRPRLCSSGFFRYHTNTSINNDTKDLGCTKFQLLNFNMMQTWCKRWLELNTAWIWWVIWLFIEWFVSLNWTIG